MTANKKTVAVLMFEKALKLHQAGQFDEAEECYCKILNSNPENSDALHLLGVISHQRGDAQKAVGLILRAIIIKPHISIYHRNLGIAYNSCGRIEDAINAYRQALSLQPNSADVLCNLGVLEQAQGRIAEAINCYEKALSIKPDYLEALYNLGLAHRLQGKNAIAKECFAKVLELSPDYWQARFQLSQLLSEAGDLQSAAEHYQIMLMHKPDLLAAYIELGAILQKQLKYDLSLQVYDLVISKYPQCAEAFCNRGKVLMDLCRVEDAIRDFRKALELDSNLAVAQYNLGNAFHLLGRLDDAAAAYRSSLSIRPNWPDAMNNLGDVLQAKGLLHEAESLFEAVLRIQPTYFEAYNNLGNVYKNQARLDDAIFFYRQALELNPSYLGAHSNLLFSLSMSQACSPEEYLEEARLFGQRALFNARPFTHKPAANVQDRTRLRVGMVSGDFRFHPVSYFLEGVLSNINPNMLELIAYSSSLYEDDLTARIRPYFSGWRSIVNLGDSDAAELIREDGIDVLIDLAGHTALNRVALFAWKPAPVQITWLGYFASTGVPGMDYILADSISVPKENEWQFTEKVWNLPESRLCFSEPENETEISSLPAMSKGFVTYGCMQALSKLNDEVLRAWGEILSRQTNAKLLLQNKRLNCQETRDYLLARLKKVGIDSSRLMLLEPESRAAYLRTYEHIDIALDSFPYPGGTTTCEALWMGVPTLTLAGNTMLSRQGASLMTAAGFPEFVATSVSDYIEKALLLGQDIERLAGLRQGMREQIKHTSVFDSARFAICFEKALLEIHKSSMADECVDAIN